MRSSQYAEVHALQRRVKLTDHVGEVTDTANLNLQMSKAWAWLECNGCGHKELVAFELLDYPHKCPKCGNHVRLDTASAESHGFHHSDLNKKEPPEKDLPLPMIESRTCRECEREFVPALDHRGFIDVCPSCSGGHN